MDGTFKVEARRSKAFPFTLDAFVKSELLAKVDMRRAFTLNFPGRVATTLVAVLKGVGARFGAQFRV